jgi:hypothetical protein
VIDLWITLIPLIVGSAVLPIQITITILLLRAEGGRRRALGWVSGMVVVRLAQGIVFGLVLGAAAAGASDPAEPSGMVSVLLLVIGVLFLVAAARKLLDQPDEDAPPPRWMAAAGSLSPARALGLGAGISIVSAKLWVFTLGAISAIEYADLGQPQAIATYLAFTAAAVSVHLAIIGVTVAAPARGESLLGGVSSLLERHGRSITVGLGLVFGTWFIAKALGGLGVL